LPAGRTFAGSCHPRTSYLDYVTIKILNGE
jgi:hypothetical protein